MGRPLDRWKYLVLVCHDSDCKKQGAKEVRVAAKNTIRDLGLRKECMLVRSRCTGHCKRAPIACIQPANVWIDRATPKSVSKAIEDELG